jgi:hypothetical protein
MYITKKTVWGLDSSFPVQPYTSLLLWYSSTVTFCVTPVQLCAVQWNINITLYLWSLLILQCCSVPVPSCGSQMQLCSYEIAGVLWYSWYSTTTSYLCCPEVLNCCYVAVLFCGTLFLFRTCAALRYSSTTEYCTRAALCYCSASISYLQLHAKDVEGKIEKDRGHVQYKLNILAMSLLEYNVLVSISFISGFWYIWSNTHRP